MINAELHKQPVALDREQHRKLRLRQDVNHLAAAQTFNAFFLTAAEFGDACKEYPILFLPAGKDGDGKTLVAPVAVFGLAQGENLFLQADGRWDAHYVPAILRAYPFTMARVADDRYVVCFDAASPGVSETEGTPLFQENGEGSTLLQDVSKFVEQVEVEVERTRLIGKRLMELNLLKPKRFDAKLSDGTPVQVDGFLAADEETLNALPDADLLDLQRNGLLMLLHAHQFSMGNMRRLIDRRLARLQTPG
ncbi:SapC family protein [Ideonella livida]|uniref:SapC family protein n=1 Tax=Ideonella livida TaxID=2707176 RepID=A0A7C9PI63_9BURK|nr:SapC family protein [Ideonella livida]NDY91694.1 SapC family protein [Ideonella livida]